MRDRYVSFLPLAWIGEQILAVACGLRHGLTLSFPEDAATQRTDLREIAPDVMFSPPRIWESMLSEVQVRIDDAGRLKRRVFGWAYEVGDRMAAHRTADRVPGALLRTVHGIANAVGLRPVRDWLGLSRIKRCYTGGAPLSPDLLRLHQREPATASGTDPINPRTGETGRDQRGDLALSHDHHPTEGRCSTGMWRR